MPAEMPELAVATDGKGMAIAPLLKQAGLAPSTSEANRNIEQGGVKVDGQKISDRALHLPPGTYVLQVGKRKWARVTLA
jgi:tyrosyl-tRNA synthetase